MKKLITIAVILVLVAVLSPPVTVNGTNQQIQTMDEAINSIATAEGQQAINQADYSALCAGNNLPASITQSAASNTNKMTIKLTALTQQSPPVVSLNSNHIQMTNTDAAMENAIGVVEKVANMTLSKQMVNVANSEQGNFAPVAKVSPLVANDEITVAECTVYKNVANEHQRTKMIVANNDNGMLNVAYEPKQVVANDNCMVENIAQVQFENVAVANVNSEMTASLNLPSGSMTMIGGADNKFRTVVAVANVKSEMTASVDLPSGSMTMIGGADNKFRNVVAMSNTRIVGEAGFADLLIC